MPGSTRNIERNNREFREIVIGLSMAPRLFESPKILDGGSSTTVLPGTSASGPSLAARMAS
jgi:hypothetical protein